MYRPKRCLKCKAKGYISGVRCWVCNGRGVISTTKIRNARFFSIRRGR